MPEFSIIAERMERSAELVAEKAEMQLIQPWNDKERTESARLARIVRAEKDFWEFDKMYFTEDMYEGGWFPPNTMLISLIKQLSVPGVHVNFGPRGFGKTVTLKKGLVWLFLTGKITIGGVYAETLDPKSRNILKDVRNLIAENDRIGFDYKPVFKEDNSDQFQFRTLAKGTSRKWRYCAAFSEGRSVRGFTRGFGRPKVVIGDDVETLESSITPESTLHRIDKIAETYQSLTNDGVFTMLGNDFDRRTALHRLKVEQELGILAPHWHVNAWAAWIEKRKKSLWDRRYPCRTEQALKAILKPRDEADWQANFQQNPVPPEGMIFKSAGYHEYSELPKDAKGVIYTDPNLSLKGMGDTTAITALLFSPTTGLYYIPRVRCRSYSDPNLLLDDVLVIKGEVQNIRNIGWDGNVAQESTWSANIHNWCKIKGAPYPRVQYRRYHIDELSKNCQGAWDDGLFRFPEGFSLTKEGSVYLEQVYAFRGKKAKKKDDAPDSLIASFELIHEMKVVRSRISEKTTKSLSVSSNFDF